MKTLSETTGAPTAKLRSKPAPSASATYNPLTASSPKELELLGFNPIAQFKRPSKVPQPIIASAVAEAVLEEASVWLKHPLPSEWAAVLTFHAETICAHNPRFRRRLDTKDNTGRDRLWAFMRHWLCAIMAKELPDLHRRLPSDYNVGRPLPLPASLAIDLRLPAPSPTRRRAMRPRKQNSAPRAHGLLPEPI